MKNMIEKKWWCSLSLSPSLLKHLVLKCIEIMVVIGVVGFVHLLYNVFYVNTDGI
jgi:hypothetical protein